MKPKIEKKCPKQIVIKFTFTVVFFSITQLNNVTKTKHTFVHKLLIFFAGHLEP